MFYVCSTAIIIVFFFFLLYSIRLYISITWSNSFAFSIYVLSFPLIQSVTSFAAPSVLADLMFDSCTACLQQSFWAKSQFHVIFGQDSFLREWVHFRLVSLHRTLRTTSVIMDGGIPAFTITLFLHETFPSQMLGLS